MAQEVSESDWKQFTIPSFIFSGSVSVIDGLVGYRASSSVQRFIPPSIGATSQLKKSATASRVITFKSIVVKVLPPLSKFVTLIAMIDCPHHNQSNHRTSKPLRVFATGV